MNTSKHADAPQPIADCEELWEIIDGTDKSFKVIQRNESGGKHDCTDYSVLLQHVNTGLYYGVDYESSYNHGFDSGDTLDFPYSLKEVAVSSVLKYTWKRK